MKKGVGHIEIVIAFVLFVTFLGFLFLYVKPYSKTGLSDSVVTSLKENFEKQVFVTMTTFFIKGDDSCSCFSIPLSGSGKSFVQTLSGENVNSSFSGVVLTIAGSCSNSYKIYISEEFPSSNYVPQDCNSAVIYSSGDSSEENVIAYSRVEELKERYNTDYSSLKKDLKIPDNLDFSATIGDTELSRQIPQQSEVFAQQYLYKMINQDGKIENTEVILREWA